MIVNMRCNISTLDIVDFWENPSIDTNVKLKEYTQNTNHKFKNTNIKLKESTHDITNTKDAFKKRLKLKSNKYQRLQYNNEKTKEIKKNHRNGR